MDFVLGRKKEESGEEIVGIWDSKSKGILHRLPENGAIIVSEEIADTLVEAHQVFKNQ
ncbi:MAG: hypothetical protein ABIG60_04270 [Patescibacteria group bacterium]